MHLWDWIVIALVALLVAGAVIFTVKRRKKGCCSRCEGCVYGGTCGKKKAAE